MLSVSGCGDDEPGETTRACDWSADPAERRCSRATGPTREVVAAEDTCAAMDGAWATQCPTADLIGCCHFSEFGLARADCFYTKDPPWAPDPETACHVEHDPAVWTTTL
jgi:hypothetical protein